MLGQITERPWPRAVIVPPMPESSLTFRVGGFLYNHAFPAYRIAYSAYKAVTEKVERRLMRQYLKPGATAIDVGANIGSHTLYLSKLVGADGRVVAFEPDQQNYARLVAAVAKRANVEAVQAAIGATTGEANLYESADLNVDHRTYDPGGDRRHYRVRAYRLDDFLVPGDPVDLIKMDIQGAEYDALGGMQRVLTENPGVVMLAEYWPAGLRRAGSSASQLLEYLMKLGFDVEFVVGGSLTREVPRLGESISDYTSLVARR